MENYKDKQLGAYTLLEKIGEGGMATVYKARQSSVERFVAIKILPQHLSHDPGFVTRFTQEARTLARLEHPHILPIYDYGEQDGLTFLAMRYNEAGSLRDWMHTHPNMHLQEIVRIVEQIGQALDYAHSKGVVHRDLKPDNILVDPKGNTFLTDFGIAKLLEEGPTLTKTGTIIGTPEYMAPEQCSGADVDARSDIYALGVILYQLLTGRLPYTADTVIGLLYQHVNTPPPSLHETRPELPAALEGIINTALAKAPADRFQSAEALVIALKSALDSHAPARGGDTLVVAPAYSATTVITPHTPTQASTSPKRAPRNPWGLLIGGLGLLCVLLTGLFFGGQWAIQTFWGTPTPTDAAPTLDARMTLTPDPTHSASLPQPTPDVPTAQGQQDWTYYTNGNQVLALAHQGQYLWAGGHGGLVRWNLSDRTYVKYTMPDGLISVPIIDMLVDSRDQLWIATTQGAGRLNANEWQNYTFRDGLIYSGVTFIYEDPTGIIWVGLEYGSERFSYFDGQWHSPQVAPLPDTISRPLTLIVHPDGRMFAGFYRDGLGIYDGTNWQFWNSTTGIPGDTANSLLLLPNSSELLVTLDSQVIRFNVDTFQWSAIEPLEEIRPYRLYQNTAGDIWVLGERGIAIKQPDQETWEIYRTGTLPMSGFAPSATQTSNTPPTDLAFVEATVCLSTYQDGLLIYDGETWQSWRTEDQLRSSDVEHIIQDGQGAVWFIHKTAGLTRYDPLTETWADFDENNGAEDRPGRPGIDPQGNIWISGYGVLKWYNGERWQTLAPPDLSGKSINGVAFASDGTLWANTYNSLLRRDPQSNQWTIFTQADHPALEVIRDYLIATDGVLWLLGQGGIVRYDGTEWQLTPGLEARSSGYLAQDDTGTLWLVSSNLYRYNGQSWELAFQHPNSVLNHVAPDPTGMLWMGRTALGRYDPTSTIWEDVVSENDLPYPYINTLFVARDGTVWVGTPGGVGRYVP